MQVPKQPIPHLGSGPWGSLGPWLSFGCALPFGCALLLVCALSPLFSHAAEPPRRIPLDPLGFQPLPTQFLLAGSSMLTIHYVDETHMLVTFSVRRLLRRLAEDPPDDMDRNVDAILIELPTGRVLARTSWRLHDHAQYLWSIGHGRFLLRVRDTVTLFSPLTNLAKGEAFRESPFLNTTNRRIAEIAVSPDDKLLTVETIKRNPPAAKTSAAALAASSPSTPESVQINFYRIPEEGDAEDRIRPRYAGVIHSNTPGDIPASSAGYIDVLDQGSLHWAFDFDAYSGKKKELAAFDSTCRPVPVFVSPSEFIAFGCRSGSSRQVLGSFNMNGEEPWEQNLFSDYVAPSLAFEPAKGRFVLSRVLVHDTVTPGQPIVPEQMGAQTVIVYQTSSGRQLLRTECTPVEPAGQNYALSPNGLSLAAVRDGAIEIFSLPKSTAKEDSALKLALASNPEDAGLPVHFAAAQQSTAAESTGPENAPEAGEMRPSSPVESLTSPPPGPGAAPARANGDPTPPNPLAEGDPAANQSRPRPTLYTLPTDPPRGEQQAKPQ